MTWRFIARNMRLCSASKAPSASSEKRVSLRRLFDWARYKAMARVRHSLIQTRSPPLILEALLAKPVLASCTMTSNPSLDCPLPDSSSVRMDTVKRGP